MPVVPSHRSTDEKRHFPVGMAEPSALNASRLPDKLFISPVTVRNHVTSVLRKLQVTNRRQAMLLAGDPAPRLAIGRPVGVVWAAEDAGCFIVFKAKRAAAPVG